MNPGKFFSGAATIKKDIFHLIQRQKDFLGAKPRAGTLFLTYRCTSRCRACSMWRRTIEGNCELGEKEWKNILNQLSGTGVRVVEFFGGDVFLRKRLLTELIRYSKGLGLTVHMPVNSILMDDETAYDIVQAGVDCIYISTDGVGEEHDKIRGVRGNFDRLQSGVKLLQEARGKGRLPSLVCNITISKLNLSFLEQIIDFAYRAKFDVCALEYVGEFTEDHIRLSHVDGIQPDPYYLKQGSSLLLSYSEAKKLKRVVRKVTRLYRNTGMVIYSLNIDTLSIKDLANGTVPMKKCYIERNEVTVDPYGNVIVCPFFSNYILGNLMENSLKKIWNSEKHLRFREKQNSGDLEICRHCIMMVERCYGIRKGLERIYYKRIREKLI